MCIIVNIDYIYYYDTERRNPQVNKLLTKIEINRL